MMQIPAVMVFLPLAIEARGRALGEHHPGGALHGYSIWEPGRGNLHAFYLLFGIVEMACKLLIVWYAWKWRNPESLAASVSQREQIRTQQGCAAALTGAFGQAWTDEV
ncbi:MAG: hypothetical protein IPM84_11075 [Anaerolineae bacterium]|nr:hypothetical protein [Anaerolineae bacterium]